MNADVEWEAPTPRRVGRSPEHRNVAEFLTALAKRPGRWAVYRRDTHASGGRHVRLVGERLGFDVETTHRTEPGSTKGTLYVRVLGPLDEAER